MPEHALGQVPLPQRGWFIPSFHGEKMWTYSPTVFANDQPERATDPRPAWRQEQALARELKAEGLDEYGEPLSNRGTRAQPSPAVAARSLKSFKGHSPEWGLLLPVTALPHRHAGVGPLNTCR
jgi:hypothetical protein